MFTEDNRELLTVINDRESFSCIKQAMVYCYIFLVRYALLGHQLADVRTNSGLVGTGYLYIGVCSCDIFSACCISMACWRVVKLIPVFRWSFITRQYFIGYCFHLDCDPMILAGKTLIPFDRNKTFYIFGECWQTCDAELILCRPQLFCNLLCAVFGTGPWMSEWLHRGKRSCRGWILRSAFSQSRVPLSSFGVTCVSVLECRIC